MTDNVAVPAHVPRDLVRDFDLYAPPGIGHGTEMDIHVQWKAIQDSHPDIFWTPRYGGHWVVTRYAEIQRLCMETDKFSNADSFIPKGVMPWMIPVQLDPPEHGLYRKLLMPAFAPASLNRASARARSAAIEIIEEILPRGGCDFTSEFATVMPIVTFLNLINCPEEDFAYLREKSKMAATMVGEEAQQGWAALIEYAMQLIAKRRVRPEDDLTTSLLNARVHDRPLSDEEILSMMSLVIGGGLDTVASMTALAGAFLARSPEHQRELVDHPDRIDSAVEEITRRFGTSNLARGVRQDLELGGVQLRHGDIVLGIFPLAGLDERVNDDPLKVDFSRRNRKHLNFGSGPHTCIGNGLARRELRIFLEEWFKRIPSFRLAPDARPVATAGLVNQLTGLKVVWDFA